MSTSLNVHQRQKNVNALIIDFDFHGVQFDDIMRCFQISLKNVDQNCALNINDSEKFVWISVLTFLNDMKQQQIFAEFLSSKATFNCRFCNAESHNRDDLIRDFVIHERYYHEILVFWRKTRFIKIKTKSVAFFNQHDFKFEFFVLK